MNKIRFIVLVLISITFVECAKKDEPTPSTLLSNALHQVSYKDQDLKGQMNGTAWEYITGNVSYSDFGKYHIFNCVDTVALDTCFIPSSKHPSVLFSISDSVGVLEPGVHKLSFSATAGGETVTLVYYEDGSSTPNNIIATSGEYEILTVDKTNNIVTGKMDAFYDDDNFVNGNFSLKICD